MAKKSSRNVVLLVLLALLVAGGAWLYSQRVQRVPLAGYVPDSALGYVEINDWPRTLDGFLATKAWQQLAPLYGMDSKRGQALQWVGKLGGLAQFGGVAGVVNEEAGQAALLARSQLALVITGLEVRGEGQASLQAVRPRWALLAETHSNPAQLRTLSATYLPQLAQRLLGQVKTSNATHAEIPITIFSAGAERQLLAAQIEGELILANHREALQACIDARLKRVPTLAQNAQLQQGRASIGANSELTGFITSSGVARLLRFGAYVIAGGAGGAIGPIGKAAVAGAVGDVLTDFASKASDGVAYGLQFEQGAVVDRYAWLLKPDLLATLRQTIKVNEQTPRALQLIPATAQDVTVLTLENPAQAFTALEQALSARVGIAQSFLLRHFLNAVQESFFGLKSDDALANALGDEVATLNLDTASNASNNANNEDSGEQHEGGRVWLLAVRDQAKARALLTKVLGNPPSETRQGVEFLHSPSAARGSAALLNGFVALGQRVTLQRLIEQRRGQLLAQTPQYLAASKPNATGISLSISATKEPAHEMMYKLAHWLGTRAAAKMPAAIDQLPLAASVTRFDDHALLVESRAPFGNFPFLISLLATARE